MAIWPTCRIAHLVSVSPTFVCNILFQWNFDRDSYISIQENVFEYVVWKMAAVLFRPQCVKGVLYLFTVWYMWPDWRNLYTNYQQCTEVGTKTLYPTHPTPIMPHICVSLTPVRRQTIPEPILTYSRLDLWTQMLVKFESKAFQTGTFVWKCLRNTCRGHFCPGARWLLWLQKWQEALQERKPPPHLVLRVWNSLFWCETI